MTCEDCAFWEDWNQGNDRGYCRKHCPVVVAEDGDYGSVWPDTLRKDYCGDIEAI